MYILGGFLALGALLDSVANAISLLTPLVASIGTACIVLVWVLAHIILPSHPLPWVFGTQRIGVKKLGIQPTAFAVGMVLLLWMPSVIARWQTLPPPSPDKGIGVEKLDTIQRNTENIQQGTQHIVVQLEQELSIKNTQILFLQGQVERLQAQEPSPRARELAAHIPSDADPYALALKAIREGQKTGLPHTCKISPDIACILLREHPRQNGNIEERRGVCCLRNMRQMKENYP